MFPLIAARSRRLQTVSFAGLTEPFVQTYRYDSLYRITEARETNGPATNASQNWKESFGYDRFGNRTTFTKFTGTTQLAPDNKTFPSIDPDTNRFNPNQGYLYDKKGNLISDAEGRSFVFNGENKQAQIIKDGKLVGEYDYNGEGQRVRKRTYDANGFLQDTTVFVYSAGKLVAEYTTAAPPTNPTTRYTATDMLGSPRVITDSQGNVIARRDFKPFGEEITSNTGERTTAAKYGAADNLRQKFTTYQRDEETGLDFAEARMYENRHGRFTAVDPLLASGKSANPQTFNRFVYVGNDPINMLDPSGLDWYCGMEGSSKRCRWSDNDKNFKNGDSIPDDWKRSVGEDFVQEAADNSGWIVMDPYSSAFIREVSSKEKGLSLFAKLYDYSPEKRAFVEGYNRNYDTNMKILTALALAEGAIAAAPAAAAFAELAAGTSGTLTTLGIGAADYAATHPNETSQLIQSASRLLTSPAAQTAASVIDKLNRYLLNPNHVDGGPKAKWFEQALGFTRANAEALARQIVFDQNAAVQTSRTEFGTKFTQTISIVGTNGRTIDVPFVWIRLNDGIVKLVTAIPQGK